MREMAVPKRIQEYRTLQEALRQWSKKHDAYIAQWHKYQAWAEEHDELILDEEIEEYEAKDDWYQEKHQQLFRAEHDLENSMTPVERMALGDSFDLNEMYPLLTSANRDLFDCMRAMELSNDISCYEEETKPGRGSPRPCAAGSGRGRRDICCYPLYRDERSNGRPAVF